ncbi:hypothetical protein Trydic_g18177 [Trypoxylus dichotomus]
MGLSLDCIADVEKLPTETDETSPVPLPLRTDLNYREGLYVSITKSPLTPYTGRESLTDFRKPKQSVCLPPPPTTTGTGRKFLRTRIFIVPLAPPLAIPVLIEPSSMKECFHFNLRDEKVLHFVRHTYESTRPSLGPKRQGSKASYSSSRENTKPN